MEEKRLKQFTFYDLYYEALKGLPDEAAGRMAKNVCRFMFTNEEIPEPQDDRENFFWSNIKDVLEEDKRIESSGRQPKNLKSKMRHFTFCDTNYKALNLMSDAESGQYIKAICEYMFYGTERKLKPPVDMYFSFAKKKLELSRKRKSSGSKGGATTRVKVSDKEISKATEKKNQYVSFDDFMAENPQIKNDLYASRMHLLDGVNWMKLDCGLEKSEYKDCDSLYRILMHKEEIMNNGW